MKLTSILILAASIHVAAAGHAQRVTLTLKDAPLKTVFFELNRQTGYNFLYTDEALAAAKKVTISVKNAGLDEVLALCFKDQPLEYTIKDNAIVVKQKEKSPNEQGVTLSVVEGPPPIDVTGRVTDKDGNPLSGATISVKGSDKKGTTSAPDGSFTLKGLSPDDIIIVSYVGYKTQTIKIGNRTNIVVALELANNELGEVIINKGYYTEKQRNTVGNVTHIDSKVIEQQPVQNSLLALQGRVPGLEITQLSGMNGAGVKVRIQGQNSLRSDALDPLIVIDGVPYPSKLAPGMQGVIQDGSPLSYINLSDIESIDVLKDADATSIYGSRAANGAILITTKKGKVGKTKLNVNLQQGWGKVAQHVDMLNTQQYLAMRREAFRNNNQIPSSNPSAGSPFVYAPDLMFWDTTRYTDWQKELIGRTAQYTNVNASISGGTQTIQYMVGGTFNRQTTVFPGKFDDKKSGVHFNINGVSSDQRLMMQFSGSYIFDNNHLPGIDLTQTAVLMEPNAPPLYNQNGTLNWAPNAAGTSTFINPLAYTVSSDFENTTNNLVSNMRLSYRILPGLELSSSLGYTNMQSELYLPVRLEFQRPERRASSQRYSTFGNTNLKSWIIEPQLQYVGKLSKGKIEGLVGATIQKSRTYSWQVTGFGFPTDLLMKNLQAATSTSIGTSGFYVNRFNALFGRVNYNWGNKYLINVTARRDGSNKFGDKNKFHNFWSTGIGWIFSEEKWIEQKLPFLSFGKLRASYGTTGNDQIPDFSYLSLYTISSPTILYQDALGFDVLGIANPYLQWEETHKWQAGIDLGFMKDRAVLGVTYSNNKSSNQLVGYIIPAITGFESYTKNLPALIRNTSWELTVNTVNIKKKDFTWSSSINLTIPRNKLVSFPGIELTGYASGNNGVIVGQPLGVAKVYKYGGVNPANGVYLGLDGNGNPTSNSSFANKNILISPFSKYYGGFLNSIQYKGFQVDFLFQFVRKLGRKDMYFYNGSLYPGQYFSGSSNQPVNVLNRWQKPGDNAIVSKFSTGAGFNLTGSDENYSFDASYVRLKNISLSWQLPADWLKKAHLQNARLYIHGQNLATITNYKGLDPETMSSGVLPPLRMITVGGQIEF